MSSISFLNRRLGRSSGTGLALLSLLAVTPLAWSQQTTDRMHSGGIEEITVTGTKREVSSQDVPIAVSALNEQALRKSPFNDVRALGAMAPGLVLSNPAGFNATGGGMRGTGTNIIIVTQDAPVSFLVDEFVLSHVTSQFVDLFDIEQVEIYRGPQGTLFGKNTTGGVIAIGSKRPVLGEYSLDAEFGYGLYDSGAATNTLKAAVNLPLNENMALRVAAIADSSDGFYQNDKRTATFPDQVPLWRLLGVPQGTPLPPEIDTTTSGTGSDLGGKDVLAAKAKLLFEPNDSYSAYLIAELVRDRSDSPPGVNESSATDLLTLLGFPGIRLAGQSDVFRTLLTGNDNIEMGLGHQIDARGVYLTQEFALNRGTVKAITGYREEQQRLPSTYTGEAFLTLFDSARNTERYTFQQEIRYVSDFDSPFNFVTGANYFHDNFNFRAFFSVGLTSLIPPARNPVRQDGRVNLDTRALFDYQFQGTSQSRDELAVYWDGFYSFTDQWRLTLGLRYSQDEKEFLRFVDGGGPCTARTEARDRIVLADGSCRDSRSHYISRAGVMPRSFNGRDIPLPLTAFGTIVKERNEWDELTYRVVLDYTLDSGNLLYGSYATGFLSGGFSETCATVSRCSYNPETNSNIEFGYKSDLLDGSLRFNAAAFYTKYENLQRAVVATYTAADNTAQQETVTVNTGTSELYGIDVDTIWLASDKLRVTAAVNWLDHEYTSGILPDLRGTNRPVPLKPFKVPFSPEFKANLGLDYDWSLAGGGYLKLSGLLSYQSEAETDVFNGPNTQMEARTLVNLSATWFDASDRWSLTFYVANATDEQHRIAALPVAGLWNFTNYGAPRTYGMRIEMRMENL